MTPCGSGLNGACYTLSASEHGGVPIYKGGSCRAPASSLANSGIGKRRVLRHHCRQCARCSSSSIASAAAARRMPRLTATKARTRSATSSPRTPELALPTLDSLGLWKIVTGDVLDHARRHAQAGAGCASARRARTRRPAIGKSPASCSTSRSARSRRFPDELVQRDRARGGRRIHRQLSAERHRRSSRNSAPSTCAPANRSSTRPPIPCCRSPRTRASSRSSASTKSAASRAGMRRAAHRPRHRAPLRRRARRVPAHRAAGTISRWCRRAPCSMPSPKPACAVHGVGKISDIFAGSGITRLDADRLQCRGHGRHRRSCGPTPRTA